MPPGISADYKPRAGFLSIKRSWLHIVSAKKAENPPVFLPARFAFSRICVIIRLEIKGVG
jgi:hypothetical protein